MQSYSSQYSQGASYAGTQVLTLAEKDDYGQKGWRVTVHNYYPADKRDDWSTFAFVHKDKTDCQEFNFVPFGSHYKIYLLGNNYNQKGWAMTCHSYYPADKRDDSSSRVFFHKEDNKDGQLWQPVYDEKTGKHRIALADPNSRFNGWFLTAHNYYQGDKRDEASHVLFLHHDQLQGQLFDLKGSVKFAGKNSLVMADDAFGQRGWIMTCHNYYPKDKRDEWSTYVEIHSQKKDCQEFDFVQFGNDYKIYLTGNEYHQRGWAMTCHKHYPADKRDDASYRVFLHKEDNKEGQLWQPVYDEKTGKHRIILADKNSEFRGWYLTAHRYYDNDKRDEMSSFLFVHKEIKEGQLWDFHHK